MTDQSCRALFRVCDVMFLHVAAAATQSKGDIFYITALAQPRPKPNSPD